MPSPTFSQLFRTHRERIGATQVVLAKRCREIAKGKGLSTGMQASRISELEGGRTGWLTFKDLQLLLLALSCDDLRRKGRADKPARAIQANELRELLLSYTREEMRHLFNQARTVGAEWKIEVKPRELLKTAGGEPLLSAREVLVSQAESKAVTIYAGVRSTSEIPNDPDCARMLLEAAAAVPGREYVLIFQDQCVARQAVAALLESMKRVASSGEKRRAVAQSVRIATGTLDGAPGFDGQTMTVEVQRHNEIVRLYKRVRVGGSFHVGAFTREQVSPSHARLLETMQRFAASPNSRTLEELRTAQTADPCRVPPRSSPPAVVVVPHGRKRSHPVEL